MVRLTLIIVVLFFSSVCVFSQEIKQDVDYERHGVVWSGGVFKSWLKDYYIDFNKVGEEITPVFSAQKKMGLAINSQYMYKPHHLLGVGLHIGLGLDMYSYVESPVLLFGVSLSYGREHEFIVNIGLADSKRRYVPSGLKVKLEEVAYTEIPTLHEYTQFNTAYYIGISYRIFK